MRAIMTMGDVKGIIEHQKASGELGSFMTVIITMKLKMMGSVMGSWSCCESCTLSTAEPTAANIAE